MLFSLKTYPQCSGGPRSKTPPRPLLTSLYAVMHGNLHRHAVWANLEGKDAQHGELKNERMQYEFRKHFE